MLLESPHAHHFEWGRQLHRAYLDACIRHSILRGECPIATHKLYTDCLDDEDVHDRQKGMDMLQDLMSQTQLHAVYYDLGVSQGMLWGVRQAIATQKPLECRSLYAHPLPPQLKSLIDLAKRNT